MFTPMLKSASISWMIRSLVVSGFSGCFSSIVSIKRVQRLGAQQQLKGRAVSFFSVISSPVDLRAALFCSRCRPEGDEDVFSGVFLIMFLNSSSVKE